jgi:predicted  nucleic acid-binding Zn-ribbon protein
MKIRKSTVVVKTLAQKAKEARQEEKAKRLAAMKVEFRLRDKKALTLERELDKHADAIKAATKNKTMLDKHLATAQRKHGAAVRRLDREEKKLRVQLEAIAKKRTQEEHILDRAERLVNSSVTTIAHLSEKTPKLQARVDSAFKRKNSLEDRIARQTKAPKEYDLSK